MNHILNKQLG